MPNDPQFYDRLRVTLNEQTTWPAVYLFKFIVPADNRKVALIQALFNEQTSEIQQRSSAEGNYISVSIREVMSSADEIIAIYQKAEEVEGLIAL